MDRLSTHGQMIDQINLREVPHSGFDRSNHNFGSGRLGAIIPTRLDEVYPGDRIKGRPEIVANFEPLVAPLMGSMVLKQESFFVPYPQLWKDAYKFFTGKGGFNEPMPSVSPYDIFNVYCHEVHKYVFYPNDSNLFQPLIDTLNYFNSVPLTDSFADSNENHYELLQWLILIYSNLKDAFTAVYDRRKMLDLVTPALHIFEDLTTNEQIIAISESFENDTLTAEVRSARVFTVLSLIGDCFRDYFNFFHGPSSLFDYLGWPTPVDLNVYDSHDHSLTPFKAKIGIETFTISHIFTYALYRNFLIDGSFDLMSNLENYFSKVPLVFNPFKAYYLIWYWNYRDQLLETDILDPDGDEFLGSIITNNVILYCTMMRQRCWFKDTFTTALTNTGDGNLLVPVGDQDAALGHTLTDVKFYDIHDKLLDTSDMETAMTAGASFAEIGNGSISYRIPMNYLQGANTQSDELNKHFDNFISLDLFDRIRRLRNVVQKRLILGYEVDDVVYSSFMVRMSNTRIHIPEILGSGRDSVVINTLVNNTSTDMQIAGDRTATAYTHGVQSDMNYFSEEWGLYLSFMTILPIQSYAGGLQRLYLKRDPLDYAWPEFATMGMDAVYNTELSSLGTRLTDEQGLMVFGYQGRYYDLKSRQDEEHGRLLTDLNYLTFSREWDKNNPPKLNYIFVHCWPRLDGFVVDSPLLDVFRYDCYNAQAWERRLPVPSEIV